MAIETTYIYSTDNSGLLAWLQANAVPTYFDSVVADETTASTIHCYTGEHELLTISIPNASKPSVGFTVKNAVGTTNLCTYGYAGYYAWYGYRCSGGLAISAGTGSAQYIPVFITKDSSGNTTVISSTQISTPKTAYPISCADVVTTLLSISTETTTGAAATTMVPFVCGNGVGETRYTPNAFYMPTAQYSGIGKLMIDGVAYLSNGAWLLKDQ